MFFKIIYILFFVSQLLFGSIHLTEWLTPRHVMTVVMLFCCIEKGLPSLDKTFRLYIVFVSLFLVAGLGTDFQKSLSWAIAYYFVSYVGYIATVILIKKYDGVKYLLYTIIVVGILDIIVTIGQMFQLPFAKSTTDFLGLMSDSVLLEMAEERGSMQGIVIPGLIGPVANGYLLSYLLGFSLYWKDAKVNLFNFLFFAITGFALFCIQERTALIAGIICAAIVFFKTISANKTSRNLLLFVVLCSLFIIMISNMGTLFSIEDTRYSIGFNVVDERSNIFSKAISFISSNPMGGCYEYKRLIETPPHNVILNAGVYGGIIGMFLILYILLKQLLVIKNVLLHKSMKDNSILVLFSTALLTYTLNSLTHNQSIVTGDPTFWILWAVVYCLTDNKAKKNANQKNNVCVA